ncbi:MAG: 50S ribosomal protein L5 [Candidatus Lokiarchaeota archaeon]|nr:50S ribosomal protein L5 [Candidatus Lokiarchaeota archaeon]
MKGQLTEQEIQEEWDSNPFKQPYLEKVVIHSSIGQSGPELQKAAKIIELLTQKKPVLLKAKKSVKEWGIRKGQNIAVKVTLRGEDATKFLKRVLIVNDNRILKRAFDNKGCVAFGINEHITIPGVKYLHELGIIGLDIMIRIVRPGFRVKNRRYRRSKIAKNHYVSKEEAMYFMKKQYKVEVVDRMEERYY